MNIAKYWAIIPAAGVGTRMQNTVAKQYLSLKNKTVLEYAVAPFLQHPSVEKLVVCISSEDKQWAQLPLANNSKIITAIGASSRAESVLNGLIALESQAKENDWVIVHDAVRPCLRFEDLENFIEQVTIMTGPRDKCGVTEYLAGGLMAVPVRDTLKQSSNEVHIEATINRDTLWCAQTPQMFRYGQLRRALQQADLKTITDESQAIELLGEKPMLVMGRHDNIKITFPDDLALAKKIIDG